MATPLSAANGLRGFFPFLTLSSNQGPSGRVDFWNKRVYTIYNERCPLKIPASLLDAMKRSDGEREKTEKPDNAFHNCLHCGEFLNEEDSPTSKRRFCSSECFKLNRFYLMDKHQHGKINKSSKGGTGGISVKNGKRNCEYCGSQFRPKRHDRYVCSPQCKALVDQQKNIRKRKPCQ